jgi:hypothetical protein
MKYRIAIAMVAAVLAATGAAYSQPVQITGPVTAGASATPADAKSGLHITGKQVGLSYQFNDGGSFTWDVQYGGTIGCGTNNVYSQGLYLMIGGNYIRNGGAATINAAGDELEIAAHNQNGVKISRRIKVYKDQPLARWIDIYENTSSTDQVMNVQVQSNFNWGLNTIRGITAANGNGTEGAFGPKDWAFVTDSQNSGNGTPALLHIVCDAKSKLRPTVQVQNGNNQVSVRWGFTVPANKTVAICYFESQNNGIDAHMESIKKFNMKKALADLSSAVKKLILNIGASDDGWDVDLDRIESSDMVRLKAGQALMGSVANDSFVVQTFFGTVTLPASQVVGMACPANEGESARFLLTDGQIVSGRCQQDKLSLKLATGNTLQIPLGHIKQWAYKLSSQRPDVDAMTKPYVELRTGDRLLFDPNALSLKFRTRHGLIDIAGKDLVEIKLDNPGNVIHRVTFVNGSTLGGFLEPEKITLPLALGAKPEISREMISAIRFAAETKSDPMLTAVVLSNQDELYCTLLDKSLSITMDGGKVDITPESIASMTFSKDQREQVALTYYDGGNGFVGKLEPSELTLQIVPGTVLKVYANSIERLTRNVAMPPGDVSADIEKLIARLGAESYKDRQAAMQELITKNSQGTITPVLRKFANTSDAEVRQRIEDIIEKSGKGGGESPAPAGRGGPGIIN